MKFQYMFWHKFLKGDEPIDVSNEFNELGLQGWELVSVDYLDKGVAAYFKKPL